MKKNILLILFAILLIYFFGYQSISKFKEINREGIVIVSKFCNINRYPKSRNYEFCFYFNMKIINCTVTNVPKGYSNNLGKFYRIKYLNKYPDLIIVNFNEEVIDTTEILKAGFTKEDL